MLSFSFIILFLSLTIAQPTDALLCYVCTASNPVCADPIDPVRLHEYLEPCNGDCVTYINPYTNVLQRSCSWYQGILEHETGVKTIKGVSYTFCSTDGCNGGKNGTIVTTTKTATTTTVDCKTKVCENAGTLKSDCTCTCLPPYSGDTCQNVNCNLLYEICRTGTSADCETQVIFKLFCPILCHQKCLPVG